MVGSHNTQNKACRVGKPRPLLHASFSSRKKKLFPKYDDPETVSPHTISACTPEQVEDHKSKATIMRKMHSEKTASKDSERRDLMNWTLDLK
jgi:hypothetical protein